MDAPKPLTKRKKYEEPVEEKWEPERIKAKKCTYIKNCTKKNGHYTAEKLNSLRWLKKESNEPVTNKNH